MHQKIYGLDTINTKLPIYVVEGPLTTLSSTMVWPDHIVVVMVTWVILRKRLILVYDNEPRNKEIVRIERCIQRNQKVVIWPKQHHRKDINDMVLAGHDVMSVLKLNTYSGLEAKIKFNNWKKI